MSVLIPAHSRHLRAAGRSDRTITDREAVLWRLNAHLLPVGLEGALGEELEDWLGNADWSPGTRETYFNHVVAFYTWASGGPDPYLDYNPAAGLRRPRVPRRIPRPASDAAVAELLRRAAEPYLSRVVLAAFAGLRCMEIAQLERRDITESWVRARGKGGKIRHVDTHPLVWQHFKDWPPGPITVDRLGQPVTARQVAMDSWSYFHRDLKVNTHMHALRSWFATAVLEAGGDIPTLMELLGHAHAQTTMAYTLVRSERRARAVSAVRIPI